MFYDGKLQRFVERKDPISLRIELNDATDRWDVTRIIVEAARLERYQPTAASEQDFKDLSLASRVEASLATSSKFRHLAMTVRAEKGEVLVSGVFVHSVPEKEIVQLVKGVPGVTSVVTDFNIVRADLGEGDY